jgi:hypothetical protein
MITRAALEVTIAARHSNPHQVRGLSSKCAHYFKDYIVSSVRTCLRLYRIAESPLFQTGVACRACLLRGFHGAADKPVLVKIPHSYEVCVREYEVYSKLWQQECDPPFIAGPVTFIDFSTAEGSSASSNGKYLLSTLQLAIEVYNTLCYFGSVYYIVLALRAGP